jgi:hypothetical protein
MEVRRSLKWAVGVMAAVLLIMATAIPALAAGPNGGPGGAPNPTGQASYGDCLGAGVGPYETVTELLGMTAEEIQELRQDGQSLVQIAATKGITEEDLVDAILTVKKVALDKLVADGIITQELADLRLTRMEERVKLAVNRVETGAPDWAGAKGNRLTGASAGKGMMIQGCCNQANGNCNGVPGAGGGKMNRFGGNAFN